MKDIGQSNLRDRCCLFLSQLPCSIQTDKIILSGITSNTRKRLWIGEISQVVPGKLSAEKTSGQTGPGKERVLCLLIPLQLGIIIGAFYAPRTGIRIIILNCQAVLVAGCRKIKESVFFGILTCLLQPFAVPVGSAEEVYFPFVFQVV